MDQFFFNTQPSLWLERANISWLTDYLTVTYFLYYFYPLVLGVIFYSKKEWQILRKYAVTIVICFYIGYLGYVLIPAIGPRLYLPQQYKQELKSSHFSLELRQFLDKIQPTQRDCFPSLHNAITLLVFRAGAFFSSASSMSTKAPTRTTVKKISPLVLTRNLK